MIGFGSGFFVNAISCPFERTATGTLPGEEYEVLDYELTGSELADNEKVVVSKMKGRDRAQTGKERLVRV